MDDEARLRARIGPDLLLLRTVSLSCRQIFAQAEWSEAALNDLARQLESIVPKLEFKRDRGEGQAHDPYMDFYLSVDQLLLATLGVIGRDHVDLLNDETRQHLADLAGSDAHARIRDSARSLSAARPASASTDPD